MLREQDLETTLVRDCTRLHRTHRPKTARPGRLPPLARRWTKRQAFARLLPALPAKCPQRQHGRRDPQCPRSLLRPTPSLLPGRAPVDQASTSPRATANSQNGGEPGRTAGHIPPRRRRSIAGTTSSPTAVGYCKVSRRQRRGPQAPPGAIPADLPCRNASPVSPARRIATSAAAAYTTDLTTGRSPHGQG